jgi:hypothetical protein
MHAIVREDRFDVLTLVVEVAVIAILVAALFVLSNAGTS